MATSNDSGKTWTRSRAIAVRGFISPAGSLFQGSHFPRIAAGKNPEGVVKLSLGKKRHVLIKPI